MTKPATLQHAPIDGHYVTVNRRGAFVAPGRYLLRYERGDAWTMINANGVEFATHIDEMRDLDRANFVTATAPQSPTRDQQIIALRLNSPIRPIAGRTNAVDGLPIFDAERSPTLF